MTCQETQTKLSLYLYGELEFAAEEALEQHVEECALCERALAEEKAWHSAVNAERSDAPLELLAECRRDLQAAMAADRADGSEARWRRWAKWFGLSPEWSLRLAAASFLVFIGFSAGRFVEHNGLPGGVNVASEMGVVDPSTARIRDIQPDEHNHVRIIFDQQRAISGPVDDEQIQAWLVAAAQDDNDPGIRVDSIELLSGQAGGQSGREVRDALLNRAQKDLNAAVRLEAVEGLRRFRDDPATQHGLVEVLQHDENPSVRSKAIDVLAPAQGSIKMSPDIADGLEAVTRSGQADDYVRMRCVQLLKQVNSASGIY
jgi:anti-sigma factor RsiW